MLKKPAHPRAFTLIELLVVIAVIIILTGITVPAIKSLTKSNDQSQSTNLVRSMISNARAIAIAQHRMTGIVFFEETSQYSLPVNANQTAMQLFVEDYNQPTNLTPGLVLFSKHSSMRQYLPAGVKIATLSDLATGISTNENTNTLQQTRAILFDANGELVLRGGLATLNPGPGNDNTQGTYPTSYGDWHFLTPASTPGTADALSSPGFFLYNNTDMKAQGFTTDLARATWLKKNASVVLINANTGGVLK